MESQSGDIAGCIGCPDLNTGDLCSWRVRGWRENFQLRIVVHSRESLTENGSNSISENPASGSGQGDFSSQPGSGLSESRTVWYQCVGEFFFRLFDKIQCGIECRIKHRNFRRLFVRFHSKTAGPGLVEWENQHFLDFRQREYFHAIRGKYQQF